MATHDQVLQEDPPLQLRAEFGDVSRVQSRPRRGSRSGALKREHKRDWSGKEIDATTNPLIAVNSAVYGAPGSIAVDVTANIQALFDLQYQNNPQLLVFTLLIGYTSFDIDDPAPGQTKTLTIAYSIPGAATGNVFFRGGGDDQYLSLVVAPLNSAEVVGAFYGAGSLGIDLTTKLISYLADPGNSRQIEIGSAAFWNFFCGGSDPAPGIPKSFSIRLRKSPDSEVINQCGCDGQTIDLTLPADRNPMVVVNSALYGTPVVGTTVDVTANIQALFDLQYQANPQLLAFTLLIGYTSFDIDDLAPGQTKTLTIAYSNPGAAGNVFFRGGADDQYLSLVVTPLNRAEVVGAFYGTGSLGIDLTAKLTSYLADPGNSRQIEIGSAAFWNFFCGGSDPAPGIPKSFSATLSKSGYALNKCGCDGQTVDLTPPANQSWMTDLANSTPGFRDLKLSQICWPATHDTGTYALGSTFTTNDGAWIKGVMDTVQNVAGKLNGVPLLNKVLDPWEWVQNGILNDTQALATATHSDIRQQLDDGIRCLDLRVYYNHNDSISPFYTYHGVAGVPIETILSEVAYFISVVAPAGEIVYVTMSEYWDDNTPGNGFTKDELEQLTALVWQCFDKSQAFGPHDAGPTDLLDCTYSYITQPSVIGGNNCSKVVLVMQPPVMDNLQKIWPLSGTGSPNFSGGYADKDDVSQMILDQQNKSIQAKSNSLPFALSLTLTPTTDAATQLIENNLSEAITGLAGEVILAGSAICALLCAIPGGIFLLGVIEAALLLIAAFLLIGASGYPYSSLQELSSKIFSSAAPTVSGVYQDYFFGTQYATPSLIWMDFYEDHRMDTQAGRNVAQLVELSKALTRANAVREALSVMENS